MKIMVLGIDGYLGFPLALHLAERGHEVSGMDNLLRRKLVQQQGCDSAIPLPPFNKRMDILNMYYDVPWLQGDITQPAILNAFIEKHKPDTIVHLAEIPSAPFSMANLHCATKTQVNNVVGTLNILFAMRDLVPECALIKLGTLGELGTPNIDIPEGDFEVEYRGRKDTLPFPRNPGSFYHASKVFDSENIRLACKIWGLHSTDIMQGVVYGLTTQELKDTGLNTRFDFDEVWGTAINRFCAQAIIGHEITPYGHGGQARGFIALRDSIQCLTLAAENQPSAGEYRVFNQFDETYRLKNLARLVVECALNVGVKPHPHISYIDNPRVEAENHFYHPDCQKLRTLGFQPTQPISEEIRETLKILMCYKSNIIRYKSHIMPTVKWRR